MNIRTRLTELERKFGTSAPIMLLMRDGTTCMISDYPGNSMMRLLQRAMHESETGEISGDLALIKESIAGHEAGGRMIELVRAMLQPPFETTNPISNRSETDEQRNF